MSNIDSRASEHEKANNKERKEGTIPTGESKRGKHTESMRMEV